MTSLGDRLALALIALDRIGGRLSLSLESGSGTFPVSAATVRDDRGQHGLVRDAFLQRFQQAADHLLRKLFPRVQAAIEGVADLQPIRDTLELLHRADVVDDIAPWLTLIELRNRLTHDYALSDAELAEDLNAAWHMAPVILAQIQRVRTYALAHNLLDGASLDDD